MSNPITEPGQSLNQGDVIALFDEDEPNQPAVLFVQQQQQPLDEFFVLGMYMLYVLHSDQVPVPAMFCVKVEF